MAHYDTQLSGGDTIVAIVDVVVVGPDALRTDE